jgi:hypothetical protein
MTDDPQPTRHARISLDALGRGTVEVDGHDISDAVRGFTLSGEVGHRPRLGLELCVYTSEADGDDVQVHIPDDTAAALVALGWTPPDDGQPVGTGGRLLGMNVEFDPAVPPGSVELRPPAAPHLAAEQP